MGNWQIWLTSGPDGGTSQIKVDPTQISNIWSHGAPCINRIHAHHADPDELLGVVEAGLQQFREVVVLCRADESGDGEAVERARAGVQVRQQHAEGVTVELDHVEL